MTRIGRLFMGIAPKLDAKRDFERHGNALPRVEGVAAAQTTFDCRDSGTRQPDPFGDLQLCPSTTTARAAYLPANHGELGAIPSRSLSMELVAP
jgi:hypothetical protein